MRIYTAKLKTLVRNADRLTFLTSISLPNFHFEMLFLHLTLNIDHLHFK